MPRPVRHPPVATGGTAKSGARPDDDPARLPDLLRRTLSWLDVATVLDVGARTGEFAALVREQVGYDRTLVSFEPDPLHVKRLFALAAGDPAWRVEQLAFSDTPDLLPLFQFDLSDVDGAQSASPALYEWYESAPLGQEPVQVVRCDKWLDTAGADLAGPMFLKVDTRGNDWSVIDGISRRITDIVAIQLRLSVVPPGSGGRQNWAEVVSRLSELGFGPAGLFPITRDQDLLRIIEFDGVFIRES